MISKTEIRKTLLWTISTSVPGTLLGLYLINTFFVPLDGSPTALPTWIGLVLLLPSMWASYLNIQIHNAALAWLFLACSQFVGYGIVVTLVRGILHVTKKKRGTQQGGPGYRRQSAPQPDP